MKTSNLRSFSLMPSFAGYYAFACEALDAWMGANWKRAYLLAAPWNLTGIDALTELELQALYSFYSKIPYYPDLPRENRNNLLYLQMMYLRNNPSLDAIKALLYWANDYPLLVSIETDLPYIEFQTGIFSYTVVLTCNALGFPLATYSKVAAITREFMRASQHMNGILVNFEIEELDIDTFGLAIFCDRIVSYNVDQNATALQSVLPWNTSTIRNILNTAVGRTDVMQVTPAQVGYTQNVFYSQAEYRAIIHQAYQSKTSAGQYRATDGAFGIYRIETNENTQIFREEEESNA